MTYPTAIIEKAKKTEHLLKRVSSGEPLENRVRHVIPSVQGLPLPPPRTVRATFIAHGSPVRYS